MPGAQFCFGGSILSPQARTLPKELKTSPPMIAGFEPLLRLSPVPRKRKLLCRSGQRKTKYAAQQVLPLASALRRARLN